MADLLLILSIRRTNGRASTVRWVEETAVKKNSFLAESFSFFVHLGAVKHVGHQNVVSEGVCGLILVQIASESFIFYSIDVIKFKMVWLLQKWDLYCFGMEGAARYLPIYEIFFPLIVAPERRIQAGAHSLCLLFGSFSQPIIFSSHTAPAPASSHQPANSIFSHTTPAPAQRTE